jgi:succinyl-CoA synthetase beta subunit
MDIRGFTVHEVWVEEASDIATELYASIILDRSEKKLLAMLSAMGGMDVEEMAARDPNALVRRHVEPGSSLDAGTGRELADQAGIDEDIRDGVAEMLAKLHEVALAEDATLIEVNPLIVTTDRRVVALDAKVTIDGNALFRHPELAELRDLSAEDPQERMAKEKGITYVKLDGDIGILGNGAGLCMATLDVVAQAGGSPANFLDAGGGSRAEAIVDALEVITSDEKVRAILFNIFGGITRCDEIAKGIIEASKQIEIGVPLVVRLDGTNSEEGLRLLAEADLPNLHQEKTMLGAAERVVELAGEGVAA